MKMYSLNSLAIDPAEACRTELEVQELRDVLDQELARLPKHEREALEALARLDGKTCRSVARQYRVSPQTACNWAGTAKEKVRRKLEAYR